MVSSEVEENFDDEEKFAEGLPREPLAQWRANTKQQHEPDVNQDDNNQVEPQLRTRPNPNAHDRRQLHTIFERNYGQVEQRTRCLVAGHRKLQSICQILEHEFNRGLHRDTNPVADIKMYPTHIRDQPAAYMTMGHFAEPEEGKFLALDLGGTNFRVILLELERTSFRMENQVFSISRELMNGSGTQLFDYIADCLHTFVVRHKVEHLQLPLGFTFSFPCEQERLNHARLVAWTKGFTCSGVEGQDVSQLLQEAIKRRSDLDIEVMAVLNDTVGTLVSCAYQNRECRLGLIVGTGTNACYMEKVREVQRMHREEGKIVKHHQLSQDTTVVNTEWGAFGDNGTLDFIRTKWDREIDAASPEVGRQLFEKMIGGLYIGELCRRIMVEMALEHKLIFQPTPPGDPSDAEQATLYDEKLKLLIEGPLNKPFSFKSHLVSMVESDPVDEYENTRRALKEAFGIDDVNVQDCASVKLICSRISTRAAHLVAAAVACLLNKMHRSNTVVGVDGSMFRYHPHFGSIMAIKTKELTNPQYRFQIMFAEDGSGRGAAIVAAVACRQRRIGNMMQNSNQNLSQEIIRTAA